MSCTIDGGELRPRRDVEDPDYPLIVTLRAVA